MHFGVYMMHTCMGKHIRGFIMWNTCRVLGIHSGGKVLCLRWDVYVATWSNKYKLNLYVFFF